MPFDGITTRCIVGELNTTILNGRIEKIHQPAPEELVFTLHVDRTKHRLLVSAGSSHARLHLIEGSVENPSTAPSFCMLLRKHLQNGRIREISQKETERILEISIDATDEMGFSVQKKLIIEIMGKHSNISLVDMKTGRILDSIKRISGDVNRYRQLLPGLGYVYPPSQNKVPFIQINAVTEFKNILSARFDVERSENPVQLDNINISHIMLNAIQGLSPILVKTLCGQSNIDPSLDFQSCTADMFEGLFANLASLLQNIENSQFSPVVYVNTDNHAPVDFYPFALIQQASAIDIKRFDSLSNALEFYYENKSASSHIKQKSADLLKVVTTALEKVKLKKKRLLSDIQQAENSEEQKLIGELLTANIFRINQGDTSIEVDNYYDNTKLTIRLDAMLSPADNAQRYYKKYNKSKTAIKEKNIQLAETNGDIEYLESVLSFIENAQDFGDVTDIRQELIELRYIRKKGGKQKPEKSGLKPYAYTTTDGFKLAVGRNNKQNDTLTLKTASNKDIWFHTKDIPGSHVILFTEGKEPTEATLKEVAGIAAYHSKARASSNVPVDYTLVKHVHKPSGAKPGMVIFDHHKTLYVEPRLV